MNIYAVEIPEFGSDKTKSGQAEDVKEIFPDIPKRPIILYAE